MFFTPLPISPPKIDRLALEQKLELIRHLLQGKRVIVSFSGGVDSSAMGYLANKYSKECLLVLVDSPTLATGERELATKIADQIGAELLVTYYDELTNPNFSANPQNRCFYCKQDLSSILIKIKQEKNFDMIVDGSNFSDLSDDRPGMEAMHSAGIISPFVEAKITKEEIRFIAYEANLLNWNKPSMPCLSSRIITGNKITYEKLRRVDRAERFLRETFKIPIVRVRDRFGIAYIQVSPNNVAQLFEENTKKQITEFMRSIGFKDLQIDPKGYAREN